MSKHGRFFHAPGSCRISRLLCSSGFGLQHFFHFVDGSFGAVLLEIAGHHKDSVAHADFRHAVGAAGIGFCGLFVICHRLLLSLIHQIFQPFQLGLCGFPAEVAARKTDRGAHFQQPVIDTGIGGVGWVLDLLQGQVGGDDQRPAAAVSAVYHAVNLFQPYINGFLRVVRLHGFARLERNGGHSMIIARKLCLQVRRHLRQRGL